MADRPPIVAAGAVVLRPARDDSARPPASGAQEVLVIHRPHHDDWSLPKGKLDAGETLQAAAVREVAEETGVEIDLGQPLPDVEYQVPTSSGGMRDKVVHWWIGIPRATAPRSADGEVDTVRWVSLDDADALLTHEADRELLRVAAARPATTALLLLRHGQAMARSDWDGVDEARPLTDKGAAHATALADLLPLWGVRRVISSPAWRCVATLLQYSGDQQLTIERQVMLTEEYGDQYPQQVRQACAEWARQVSARGVPTVFCGHRPVLPTMLAGFGMPEQTFATGELAIAHLRTDLGIEAIEHVRADVSDLTAG